MREIKNESEQLFHAKIEKTSRQIFIFKASTEPRRNDSSIRKSTKRKSQRLRIRRQRGRTNIGTFDPDVSKSSVDSKSYQ